MIWLAASVVLAVAGATTIYFGKDSYSDGRAFLGVLGGGCLIVLAFVPPIVPISRAVNENTCSSYSEQTGRPVKFSIIGPAALGTCLTRSQDGRWIDVDQLRQFSQEERP